MMPALGTVLGETGVNEVASYVVSLSGGKAPATAGPKRTLDRALSRLGVASRTDAA